MTAAITSLITNETAKPVPTAITVLAEHVLSKHQGVLAVLVYGSTLRDVAPDESLIDLYILTENLGGVSTNVVAQIGCAVVPPNVYYAECQHAGKTYRAKYAALTLQQFQRRASPQTGNPYIWARFAQPCRIAWVANEKAREAVLQALQTAATTALGNAKALAPTALPQTQWITLFQNTYRTELRPESEKRAAMVVMSNAAYYDDLSKSLGAVPGLAASWALKRIIGKTLSILRLLKAAFTFQGGADYIAWKITRHSGVAITVTDWQRRHPLLAGIALLPQLLRKGAIK
jgi:hypothetical protein